MLGGRHLKILEDAHEAVGKVPFRWDRAPQKRPGRLRSGARQRVAFRQRATVPSALITPDRERVDGIARTTRGRAVASEKSRVQLDRLPAGRGLRPRQVLAGRRTDERGARWRNVSIRLLDPIRRSA